MVEKIGMLKGCGCKEKIIDVENRIPKLCPEELHHLRAVRKRQQPEGQQRGEQEVKIIEWENPQETPAVEFNEVFFCGKMLLHIQQDAADQKPGEHKE